MAIKNSVRYLLFVLLFMAVVLFVMETFITRYINSTVKAKLQSEIFKQSNGAYRLSLKEVRLNIFLRSISIMSPKLIPAKGNDFDTVPLYNISAAKFTFEGVKLLPFIMHQHLIIDKLKIDSLVALIYLAENKSTSKSKEEKSVTLYKLIQKQLQLLLIKSIELKNADIGVYAHVRDTKPTMGSSDNSITIRNFKIDKKVDDEKRFFGAQEVALLINDFSYITSDSLYVIKTKKVTASYADSILCFDELKLLPNYSKNQFGNKVGRQATRMSISVSKTCFMNMDVKKFFEKGFLAANRLVLDKPVLEAYRDKRDEFKNPPAKSIQQLIKAVPFPITVDTIKVNK